MYVRPVYLNNIVINSKAVYKDRRPSFKPVKKSLSRSNHCNSILRPRILVRKS